ncbi:nickel/cobalt transporter [Vibrio rumoiensis]|uniref:Nickel/cobalt efflux system n=1 Tax=Vibrio rumoiensis TaxID=76258 RepID=A0ABW7IRS4_9VIBR|nr:nickel/cobalt transporter [Vibrio rumoiensis]
MQSTRTSSLKPSNNRLFWVLLVGFCSFIYLLYREWPYLLMQSMRWQKDINEVLTNSLMDSQAHDIKTILYFVGLSFAYGILHSLGPGHGKVIVTTYLATHPTKIKTSLILTVLAALTQALVAISLVSVLLWGFNASMKEVNQQSIYFIDASYLIMAYLGLSIIYSAIKHHIHSNKQQPKVNLSINKIQLSPSNPSSAMLKPQQNQHHLSHKHDQHCGCGHKHFASAEDINQATNLKQYITIILGIGMRPCTGAIMVLLFSHIMGLYWLGVVSSFLMGVGTAITISTIALLTISGKKIINIYRKPNKLNTRYISLVAKLLAGLLLITIGLLLSQSQTYAVAPFLK